jgi:hypothetical protein
MEVKRSGEWRRETDIRRAKQKGNDIREKA